jgi:hypothetical protein
MPCPARVYAPQPHAPTSSYSRPTSCTRRTPCTSRGRIRAKPASWRALSRGTAVTTPSEKAVVAVRPCTRAPFPCMHTAARTSARPSGARASGPPYRTQRMAWLAHPARAPLAAAAADPPRFCAPPAPPATVTAARVPSLAGMARAWAGERRAPGARTLESGSGPWAWAGEPLWHGAGQGRRAQGAAAEGARTGPEPESRGRAPERRVAGLHLPVTAGKSSYGR